VIGKLEYETLERLRVPRPVDRVAFITEQCRDKRVLDVGCLDETALAKRDTEHWLHRRIGTVAQSVLGIDSSDQLSKEGVVTGPNSRIVKGDGINPATQLVDPEAIDVIVAGEFIEHLEDPLGFLRSIKERFSGRRLLISTPNGVSFANALLATIGREAQHRDHLLTSTYKTLNTLCLRAGFSNWRIVPYRFYATEMLLESRGAKRLLVRLVERLVRTVEYIFPLRGFGYVVEITL
jgi:2-polyprenyl-3-methyl-5-hydroxy-6-metoxy-1,4-benzoquinol methylase